MKRTLVLTILILTVTSFSGKSYSFNGYQKRDEFNKIKNLGILMGTWAYNCIYGTKDTSCERLVREIKLNLNDLGIHNIPEKLSCQKLQRDSVYRVLDDIYQSVKIQQNLIAKYYLTFRCLNEIAIFSFANISAQKDSVQKNLVKYYILFTFGMGNIQNAIRTIQNMQVPDSILQSAATLNLKLYVLNTVATEDMNRLPDLKILLRDIANWTGEVDEYVQKTYFSDLLLSKGIHLSTRIHITVTDKYKINNADFEISGDPEPVKKVKEIIIQLSIGLDLAIESDKTTFLKRYMDEFASNQDLKKVTIKCLQITGLDSY
jgi:hypothetical protein